MESISNVKEANNLKKEAEKGSSKTKKYLLFYLLKYHIVIFSALYLLNRV